MKSDPAQSNHALATILQSHSQLQSGLPQMKADHRHKPTYEDERQQAADMAKLNTNFYMLFKNGVACFACL